MDRPEHETEGTYTHTDIDKLKSDSSERIDKRRSVRMAKSEEREGHRNKNKWRLILRPATSSTASFWLLHFISTWIPFHTIIIIINYSEFEEHSDGDERETKRIEN